jgi:two-component system, NarL family, nitrate/nitrite response regulator NarL
MTLSRSSPILEPTHRTGILVADRNHMVSQLLAESLARDPRFEIVAVAPVAEVLSVVTTLQPHVALISADLDSGARNGLQLARNLHSRHPSIQIVVLLETGTRESVIAAFRCGAAGVFCRTDPLIDLLTCIERVRQGEIGAGRSHSEFLLEALRSVPSCEGIGAGKIDLLSHRELQVAECAAQGQSNKQIAHQLELSEHTVKNYLFRIFEKLGVSNRFELLFLLFKECNGQATGRAGIRSGTEMGNLIDNSIETHLRAAEQGVVAAQFIVGLAHLEGYGVEKDERSAYYWLRMAEENSCTIRHRSHALVEELRSTVKPHDIEAVEHSVALAIQENELLRSKRPAEFIKPSVKSGSLEIGQEFSTGTKAKVAS